MYGCLSRGPYWGPGLQPRPVPQLGVQPVPSRFAAHAQSSEPQQPALVSGFSEEVLGAPTEIAPGLQATPGAAVVPLVPSPTMSGGCAPFTEGRDLSQHLACEVFVSAAKCVSQYYK